ncbi:MAG: cytochrome c [Opitutaceae bacterium]|nr:cytochrome c [Opitutaceae bacterium]
MSSYKLNVRTLAAALALLALPAIGFAADAKENWKNQCAKCHSADGSGKTAMGKKLKTKDYTDAKVQESFKDEELLNDINQGVTKEGKKLMPGYKDKLSADETKALVDLIRSFKK